MDRGACRAAVQRVTKSRTQLSERTHTPTLKYWNINYHLYWHIRLILLMMFSLEAVEVYSWSPDIEGLGMSTFHGIKNLHVIYSQLFMFTLGLPCPAFIQICGSAFSDSPCLGSCISVIFTIEKKIPVWGDSRGSNSCCSRLNIGLVPGRLGELLTPNTNLCHQFSFAIAKDDIITIFKVER